MKPLLVIATHNDHKLQEIRRILGRLPFRVVGLEGFPAYAVRETGKTLEDNALLKARAGVRRTGHACLSDDTGLEVRALDGAPGVYSARYAGPGCSFEDNNRKLLRALKGVPLSKRSAVFRCVVALATPSGKVRVFEGRCPGRITAEPEGRQGFGYDPVFKPRGAGKTFAGMSLREKNAASHRARAFRKAAGYLKRKGGLLSAAFFLAVSARAGLSGPPIVDNNYRLDAGHGPVLGSAEQVAMGGADTARAHSASGMVLNPAAVAARPSHARGTWDWDGALSSFAAGGRDFDLNGSFSTAYGRHFVYSLGGLVRYKAWGLGVHGLTQRYEVETGGLERRFDFGVSHLVLGRSHGDGRWIWGIGGRTAYFQAQPKGASRKLLYLSGEGMVAGLQWNPEPGSWRFGLAWQGPIRDDPDRALAPGAVTRVDGLIVPKGVDLPPALSAGLSFARDRCIVAADALVTGRVKEANGIESFLEQRVQRSGRRATVSPRAGISWEMVPGALRLRGGEYYEPSRFDQVAGRWHLTAGFEARLFKADVFGGRHLSLSWAADLAARYAAAFFSLGFWH